MLMFLAALSAAIVPPAPPAAPAGITASMPTSVIYQRDAGQRRTLQVTVRSGGTVLWNGSIIVGTNTTSSIGQTRQEPVDASCLVSRFALNGGETTSLTLQLRLQSDDARRVNVTGRWTRSDTNTCDKVRTVEVRETITLDGQQPVSVTGDSNFLIELRDTSK